MKPTTFNPPVEADELSEVLDVLVKSGYAEVSDDGVYKLTKKYYDYLASNVAGGIR